MDQAPNLRILHYWGRNHARNPSPRVDPSLCLCVQQTPRFLESIKVYPHGLDSNYPEKRYLFSSETVMGVLLPRINYINPGRGALFIDGHERYATFGRDIISSIMVYPNMRTSFVLADAAAIKEVTSSRARFPKPAHQYHALSFYGSNIVASEGDEWKKYRKISAPAFSDRNNKLVWNETQKIVNGLFEDVWKGKDVVHVDHFLDITLPIALFVIGAAGFGRGVSWIEEDTAIPPGHALTFKDALHTVTTHFMIKLLVPKWALGLTPKFRKTRLAFAELYLYMQEMIQESQQAEKGQRDDLFTSLLEANNQELDSTSLTEDELIGNIYIFLVAGHETTAHTLCFTFALLALYQDEQEKLFQHIRSVVPSGREPTYEDMPSLTYANAVFYETLRLFPPGTGIPKVAAEDTTLVTSNTNDEKITVPIPKGTALTISIAGVHYNPRYWEDPKEFKPARFLKDWPRDAFLPFSAGARACIGRKFFETEGIVTLTTFVSKYKITVKDEPQFAGETFEQRKTRILGATSVLTLTPIRVPLTFTRRK